MEKLRLFNVVGLRAEFPVCLFKNVYLYVDSADRHSFRILKRKGIQCFHPRKAYRFKTSQRYCMVCCDLNKRDEQAFLEALDELYRDLLIMGYRDYEKYCDDVFSALTPAG